MLVKAQWFYCINILKIKMKRHNIWNLWKQYWRPSYQIEEGITQKIDKLILVSVEACKILLIFFLYFFPNELHCKSKFCYYPDGFCLWVKYVGLMIDNILVRNSTHHFACQTRYHGNTWLVRVEEIFCSFAFVRAAGL